MKSKLAEILKKKVIVIGIGNRLRGDDAVGSILAEKIKNNTKFTAIDAGVTPENYTSKIKQYAPEVILFIDATDCQAQTGEWTILKYDEIEQTGMTTHDLSPRMFLDYLKTQTNALITMLAIQPGAIGLTMPMSKDVENAINEIMAIFKEAQYA